MTTETHIPKLYSWEAYGAYFGYPICCVQAFCKLEHLDDSNMRLRPLIGTGFVPCAECACTKSASDLLGEINVNREHPTPLKEFGT